MKTYSTKNILAFYWRHFMAYPRNVVGLALALPFTILVTNFLPPLILANVLSRLSQHQFKPHHVWASFGPQIIALGLIEIIAGNLTWRLVDVFAWRLEGNIQRDISREIFAAMLKQSADFHANSFAGSLTSQTTKVLGAYVRIADTTIYQMSQLVFGLLFTLIILLPRSPQYVAALLLFALLYIASTFYVVRPVVKRSAVLANNESKQTGYIADAITNVMAIKSFARSDYEIERFDAVTNTTRQYLVSFMKAFRKQLNFFGVLIGAMNTVSLVIAIISVVAFNANIATVFLIFNYTAYVLGQLFQFSNNSLRNYNRAFGDASDMIGILAQTPTILDPVKPQKLRIKSGDVTFKKVNFQHAGANSQIFTDFNLDIKHGQKIGLVGHSGSGKTTFTRLLLRFSDITSGEILIDGQNIARITQDDLHANIAYVPQEPLLFHRTITENIGYGKAGAANAEISLAADRAHASEFIDTLPKGYDTLVGERGVKLSGGQRQRIAIARAMLKDAPILLLDEATSALDSESEVLIQDALWKLMEGRTAIVIAHRLSTIQKMDRIIVLDDGKIAEQGSHQQLLKLNGKYAKLWAHQSGGFIED